MKIFINIKTIINTFIKNQNRIKNKKSQISDLFLLLVLIIKEKNCVSDYMY